MPDDLIAKALNRRSARRKERNETRAVAPTFGWRLGTFVGGALAATLVVVLRPAAPSVTSTIETATSTPKPSVVVSPVAAPVRLPIPAPAKPDIKRVKVTVTKVARAATVLPVSSLPPAREAAAATAERPVRHTAAVHLSGHISRSLTTSPVVPAHSIPAVPISRKLPPNAVPLDDVSSGAIIVPVVITEETPDGSGVQMTPAVIAMPTSGIALNPA